MYTSGRDPAPTEHWEEIQMVFSHPCLDDFISLPGHSFESFLSDNHFLLITYFDKRYFKGVEHLCNRSYLHSHTTK